MRCSRPRRRALAAPPQLSISPPEEGGAGRQGSRAQSRILDGNGRGKKGGLDDSPPSVALKETSV